MSLEENQKGYLSLLHSPSAVLGGLQTGSLQGQIQQPTLLKPRA